MHKMMASFMMLLVAFMLVACTATPNGKEEVEKGKEKEVTEQVEMRGFLLEVEVNRVLLAQDIDLDKYEELKDMDISEIMDLEGGPTLMYLNYENTEKLKVGDQVEARVSEGVSMSLPGQVNAHEIKVVK